MGETLPDGVALVEESARFPDPDADAATQYRIAEHGVPSHLPYRLQVAAGAKVEQSIGLASTPNPPPVLGATRVTVDVGAEATCRIVERSVGPDDLNYCVLSIVDVSVGGRCRGGLRAVPLKWLLPNGSRACQLPSAPSSLSHCAQCRWKLVAGRYFDLQGENTDLDISGVNLIGGKAHIDVTSRIDHAVPHTNSTELFRNVCTESGKGVFQGQIKVAQPAQLTDARMACNTLLLSDTCDFSAKPELEIFADDVQCAHGATVADIEDDYMFYLMARGIPEVEARRLLVKAFVQEVLDEMDDETLAERLSARIDTWMEAHI